AAHCYLRAAEQACHALDLEGAMARAALGLGCAPPEELRIALLGVRCEAAAQGLPLLDAGMADAEELMRAAPPGSVAWAQGQVAFYKGALVAGRIPELLAAIARLREVEPAPDAVARLAQPYLVAICILDALGHVSDGTALEARFFAVVRPARDRDPLARFWWHVLHGMRAAYAHEDPWTGHE